MEKLKKILTLIMLPVFLYGTLGISAFQHECLSQHKVKTSLYPELFKSQEGSCCCETDISGYKKGFMPLSLESPDCCRNTHIYVTARFLAIQKLEKPVPPVLVGMLLPSYDLYKVNKRIENAKSPTFLSDPSPPLSGKLLVHFIHQMRIPSPDNSCC